MSENEMSGTAGQDPEKKIYVVEIGENSELLNRLGAKPEPKSFSEILRGELKKRQSENAARFNDFFEKQKRKGQKEE